MELKIYNPSDNDGFIKVIEWNNEEIKNELKSKLKEYSGLVYTDEQIPQAKADKAKLNKLIEALESKRKEIKKHCLIPYEKFESQVKELVLLINEPVSLIDGQIKEFEAEKKTKKLSDIRGYFENVNSTDFLKFEQIYNPKWLNASASISGIKKEIDTRIEEVISALKVLESLPNYSFEAKDMYKNTLSIEMAINEANRLVEVAKRKTEESINKPEDKAIYTTDKPLSEAEPEERQWIGFEAYLSKSEAKELKEFFIARNIKIRKSA